MTRNLMNDIQRSGARLARNAHVLFRTEHLIARRRLAVARNRGGLIAVAGGVAGIGVVMTNIALFFWLAETHSYAKTGAMLAGGNFALAGLILAIAWRMSAEQELQPAMEMRDLMLAELEADINDGLAEAQHLSDNVKRIANDPLGTLAPGLLGPILSMLVRSAKKK